jgi:RNA polymerase sigma-70 factor (ECF subfamily)
MTVAMESEEDGFEVAAERETPETILIERSNRQLVKGAIDELPAHYREVLLLCEVEEMSYREIAEILSIPYRKRHVTARQSSKGNSRVVQEPVPRRTTY